eukprot:snap_masked-scaffold_24-processed-gene-5.13-mRNA-1 protein AED:1.00 eAED:1.00 QI:0/0/0/0/1/1/2/0/1180
MSKKNLTWSKHVLTYKFGEKRAVKYAMSVGPSQPSPIRYPDFNQQISQNKLSRIILKIKKRLDIDALIELLNSRNGSSITQEFLEVFLGKCLVSDELEMAKLILSEGKKKFEKLAVTNEYFNEFSRLGKRNFERMTKMSYKHLLYMTVVRQGKYENISFMIKNMPQLVLDPVADVLDASVAYDGNMLHAEWKNDLMEDDFDEVEDESDKEILKSLHKLDQPPKEKYLIAQFEGETLLSAALKLAKNSEDKESLRIVKLLIDSGCKPDTEKCKAAQVCSELGFPLHLEYLTKVYIKQKKKQAKLREFLKIAIAHGAMENKQRIITLARIRLFPRTRTSLQKAGDTEKKYQEEFDFREALETSIKRLVRYGTERICTYRHRILYGIFVLLQWRARVDQEWGKTYLDNSVKGKLGKVVADGGFFDVSTDVLKDNEEKWEKKGILVVNGVKDYIGEVSKLLDPAQNDQAGLIQGNLMTGVRPNHSNSNSSNFSSFSEGSSRSNLTHAGGKTIGNIIKRRSLFNWLIAILQQQDYNGETLVMVLLNIGLREFFYRKKKGDEQSEMSSVYGDNSSVYESDIDNQSVYSKKSAMSITSRLSRSSLASSVGSISQSVAKGMKSAVTAVRRKSSLAGIHEFFSGLGVQIQNAAQGKKVKTSNKADSDDKTQALELASEFGSEDVMNELLELIAPEWNKTVLKCLNIAISKDRAGSTKVLYNRLFKMYETVEQRVMSGTSAGSSLKIVRAYAEAIEGYFDFIQARNLALKNKAKKQQQVKKKERTGVLKTTKRKKSIAQKAGAMMRKMSGVFSRKDSDDEDPFKQQNGDNTLAGFASKLRSTRKSIHEAMGNLTGGLLKPRTKLFAVGGSQANRSMIGAQQIFMKQNKNDKMSKKFRKSGTKLTQTRQNSRTGISYTLPKDPKEYVKFVQKLASHYLSEMYSAGVRTDKLQALLAFDTELEDSRGKDLVLKETRKNLILKRLRTMCNPKSRTKLKEEKFKAVEKYMILLVDELTTKKYQKEMLTSLVTDLVKRLAYESTKDYHLKVFQIVVEYSEKAIYRDIDEDLSEVSIKGKEGILNTEHILTVLEQIGKDFKREREADPDDFTLAAKFWIQGENILDFIVQHLDDDSMKRLPIIANEINKRNLQDNLPGRILSELKKLALANSTTKQVPLVENSFRQLHVEDDSGEE